MKVCRGDVVIVEHPFSDATGSKVRPALVVQGDGRNAALNNTVLAMITKNTSHVGSDPTQMLIDLNTADGRMSGLNVDSAVTCGNLFTVYEGRIRKKIGVLPPRLMRSINECLKAALDLP